MEDAGVADEDPEGVAEEGERDEAAAEGAQGQQQQHGEHEVGEEQRRREEAVPEGRQEVQLRGERRGRGLVEQHRGQQVEAGGIGWDR